MREQFGDADDWVIALGTNDARVHPPGQYTGLIRRMLERIGRGHRVVCVNVHTPGQPEQMTAWNDALAMVAAERSGEMLVYDWAAVAAQHPEWMTEDRIHYTAEGYRARAFAVAFGARALFEAAGPARVAPRSAPAVAVS